MYARSPRTEKEGATLRIKQPGSDVVIINTTNFAMQYSPGKQLKTTLPRWLERKTEKCETES